MAVRANQGDVDTIFNSIRISVEPEVSSAMYGFLANSILFANSVSKVGWVLYEHSGGIIFSIRIFYTVSLRLNLSGHSIEGISIVIAKTMLDPSLKKRLEEMGCAIRGEFKNAGPDGSIEVVVPSNNAENFIKALALVKPAHERFISNVLKPGTKTSWPHLYNPAIMKHLREVTANPDLPDPGYYNNPVPPANGEKTMEIIEWIEQYLNTEGYYFSRLQIASFYTALQTKGFVILSGISGTGKTKLAQLFAEMLPAPVRTTIHPQEDAISIQIQPDHKKRHRFIIPNRYLPLLQPIESNQRMDIVLHYKGQTQDCWMKFYEYPDRSPYLMFWLKDQAIQWMDEDFPEGSTLALKPEFADDILTGLTILSNSEKTLETANEQGTNSLFISVRPDWRDSKSLLGYYNPLTKTYEWTEFLKFLEQARASFEADEGLAWFVILDEMNLARVEYYFADLLSILESGRDERGYTREPLRFQYADVTDDADMPPAEIYLPPNLYFIGTVNVDETTQSFSPKVLDRAFSMEFVDVDFDRYTAAVSIPFFTWDRQSTEQGQLLMDAFTRAGDFARIEKDEIAAFIQTHPDPAHQLQELNQGLKPYNLHFGYRVFDEIIMFLINAEENQMDPTSAFDQAVLMKVLPKFHGSRGKLEKPLGVVLDWCAMLENREEVVKSALADPSNGLKAEDWRYPETAQRVLRMFQALNSTGFASFG